MMKLLLKITVHLIACFLVSKYFVKKWAKEFKVYLEERKKNKVPVLYKPYLILESDETQKMARQTAEENRPLIRVSGSQMSSLGMLGSVGLASGLASQQQQAQSNAAYEARRIQQDREISAQRQIYEANRLRGQQQDLCGSRMERGLGPSRTGLNQQEIQRQQDRMLYVLGFQISQQ